MISLLTLDDYSIRDIFSYLCIADYRSIMYTCKRFYKLASNNRMRMCSYRNDLKKLLDQSLMKAYSNIHYDVRKMTLVLKCVSRIMKLKTLFMQTDTSDVHRKILEKALLEIGNGVNYLCDNGFNVSGFNFWYSFRIHGGINLFLCNIYYKSRLDGSTTEGIVGIVHNSVEQFEQFYFYNTNESNKLKSTPFIKLFKKENYEILRDYSDSEDVLEPICALLESLFNTYPKTIVNPSIVCELMRNELPVSQRKSIVPTVATIKLIRHMESCFVSNFSKLLHVNYFMPFLNDVKLVFNLTEEKSNFFEDLLNTIHVFLENAQFL